jgi:N-acetylglucosaminyldiphosphoundecaprenol N-acetyl-beta-D-mannosaminyltransferase
VSVRADPPTRATLFDLPLDLVDLTQAVNLLNRWVQDSTSRRTVVTLNPEFVVQCDTDAQFKRDIQNADLVTADGVGITWAAKRFNIPVPGRAPGVDLGNGVMERGGDKLRVFFLGAKPGVAERAARACQQRYGVQIAGFQDGYFKPEQEDAIAKRILEADTHLLLTGLGGGKQERFNDRHRAARVAIGCGGYIDVLAGEVALAPDWTRRLGVEWIWRIITMNRWSRAKRLWDFAVKTLSTRVS